MDYLQEYTFVFKHKVSSENKVADALSRKVYIMHTMSIQVMGFERLREDYGSCSDFDSIFHSLQGDQSTRTREFVIHDGYLFQSTRLCLPHTSVRDFLIWEMHASGVAGHFGWDKTIVLVNDCFY